MGQGPAHDQGRLRVPLPPVPVPGLGPGAGPASSTSIVWARVGTTRAATISRRPAIRSRRSCSARCTTSNQTIPVYPTFNEAYTAAWINDEFKVTDRLTLTLGLRFDYQFARTEARGSVLDLRSEHAEPGGRQHSGRVDLCGNRYRAARARGSSNTRRGTPGARASVLPIDSASKHAIRGGYGIYYAGVALDQFVGLPTLGFQANLLAPEHDQRRLSGVLSGRGVPADQVVRPPFIDPTFANGANVLAVPPDGLTLAALPELVGDVPAPAHREHDAGRARTSAIAGAG